MKYCCSMAIFTISFVVVLLLPVAIRAQASCLTVEGNVYPGECVLYNSCPIIMDNIVEGEPIPEFVKLEARARKCIKPGGPKVPHVCCGNENDVSKHKNINLIDSEDSPCGGIQSNRVANGVNADFDEFPWMALLEYDVDSPDKFLCGGSIINNRYILTAAHCVSESRTKLVGVRVGEYDLSKDVDCNVFNHKVENCVEPEDYKIEKVIPHPQYSRDKFINDIALIRLDEEIDFEGQLRIQPVCIPYKTKLLEFNGTSFTIAGWGSTTNASHSSILQKGKIPIRSNSLCQKVFARGGIDLNNNHMCGGALNGTDSCQGDSGGPLFTSVIDADGSNVAVQYGIVQAGQAACGRNKDSPGIYVNVKNYVKWILDNLEP